MLDGRLSQMRTSSQHKLPLNPLTLTFCSHARTRQNIVILKKNLLRTSPDHQKLNYQNNTNSKTKSSADSHLPDSFLYRSTPAKVHALSDIWFRLQPAHRARVRP